MIYENRDTVLADTTLGETIDAGQGHVLPLCWMTCNESVQLEQVPDHGGGHGPGKM